MNPTEESKVIAQNVPELNLAAPSDRRADVEGKQTLVSGLLKELECDGLLVVQPENFAWLSSGGTYRGNLETAALPCLYFTHESRWVVCSNVDTQRLFDEELDGLGFQLKEWPWYLGREQLLNDLIQGRQVACDLPHAGCRDIAERLQKMRRTLTEYERACYRALGQIVSHSLEATGRTMVKGEPEREIAGQISHRLLHRGALPMAIGVSADGRSRLYRHSGFTSTPIKNHCVITVQARKYGLVARASRSLSFGQPDPKFRTEHDAACKISANYVASSWPDAVPKLILQSGRRMFQMVGADHEWIYCPQGELTGRAAVELELTPTTEDLLPDHCAIAWYTSVGAAVSCDTFLISEEGPKPVTAMENWPLKRIRIQGAEFLRPDILVR